MKKEKAIDYQFVRPIEVGASSMKGKIPLINLFKEYLKRLNVGFYDPCCDNPATCPPISQDVDNVVQCKPDGLYVAYQDTGGGGSVNSVGLSMPTPAFSVTNSPITNTGTIAVTMTGNSSQYLRGDGTLANFPTIVNTLDEVLSEGGELTTNRQINLGASNFNIVDTNNKGYLRINPGSEFSLGDLDSTQFGFKIKIEPRSILLGSETYAANYIFLEDIFSRITIVSQDIIANGNINVMGTFKLTSGTLGSGKVLTSDSSGIGTWQSPSPNYWTSSTTGWINNTNTFGIGIGVTSPSAYVHIKAGNTTYAPLKFTSGGLLAAPADGAIEYDGVNLYFTTGITRKIFPLGTTDTTIYTGDGNIGGPRTINVQNNTITWNNTGLFRIVEGDMTTGGTYDFNDGVDFLAFNATNSANLVINAISGFSMEYTALAGPSVLSSMVVNATGIKLTGIQDFADNAAALAGGLTAGYIYKTGDNLKIVH